MEEWRSYKLQDDVNLPETKQRTLEIKSLTVADSLLLGQEAGSLIEYIQAFVDDDNVKKQIALLRMEVLTNFARICMSTRNYVNFNGVAEPQKAMSAVLGGAPEVQNLYPLWVAEVLIEAAERQNVTEEEEGN